MFDELNSLFLAEKLENFFLVSCVDISACGYTHIKRSFSRQMAVLILSVAIFTTANDLDTKIPRLCTERNVASGVGLFSQCLNSF